eukprot:TRINITY_DN9402_c0_g1_i1.p1 TRINITY_DN9402_c0_g1~~TRINITY_DN9402_c0_g1_i1.p1  ORF type:complete len:530 (-),score=68.50 TRINITY_DN9402_c0_g1_i1:48-1637(-)
MSTTVNNNNGPPGKHKKKKWKLVNFFKKRPSKKELRDRGIITESEIDPALLPRQLALKKEITKQSLNNRLSSRMSREMLVERKIILENESPPIKVEVSIGNATSPRPDRGKYKLSNGYEPSEKKKSAKRQLKKASLFLSGKFIHKNISKKRIQFGLSPTDLNHMYPFQPEGVPAVVYCCVERILKNLSEEGLFRVPGSSAQIAAAKKSLESGKDDLSDYDVFDVCGVLCNFFRELPEPLLTEELRQDFMGASEISETFHRIEKYRVILANLPKPNYRLLQYLCEFLYIVHRHSAENKMTAGNLALVFNNSLFCTSHVNVYNVKNQCKVIEEFIVHHETIFSPISYLLDSVIPDSRKRSLSSPKGPNRINIHKTITPRPQIKRPIPPSLADNGVPSHRRNHSEAFSGFIKAPLKTSILKKPVSPKAKMSFRSGEYKKPLPQPPNNNHNHPIIHNGKVTSQKALKRRSISASQLAKYGVKKELSRMIPVKPLPPQPNHAKEGSTSSLMNNKPRRSLSSNSFSSKINSKSGT